MISRRAFIEAFKNLNTGNVEIDLFDEDQTVRVGYIQQTHTFGKGEASKQMRRLCELADRCGITLSLYVDPGSRPNPPMSKIELLKWYRRLGFESAPGRIFYMERKPTMKIEAATRLRAGQETGEGAGALFYCPDTGNFLILLRSDDNTWCGLGGGRDNMEPLETTVRREAFEEAALPMDAEYQLIPVTTVHHPNGFKFHNYLALIDEEFLPMINDEHRSFQWCAYQNFPSNMHPKMMEAFATPDGQRVLQQYTNARN